MLDTGASVNLMPRELATRMQLKPFPSSYSLRTPQGQFRTNEAVEVVVRIGCYDHPVKFLLYDDRSTVILGMGVKRAFKIAIVYDSTVLQYDEPCQTYT